MKTPANSSANIQPNSNHSPAGEREGAGPVSQKWLPSVPHGIQFRYALDAVGKTVDILSLKDHANTAGRTFRCIGCEESMVARLGSQLAHHFAHQANSQCSGETYLHQLAKQVFHEEFQLCLAQRKPFQIELPQRLVCNHYGHDSENICQTKPILQVYDLVPDVSAIKVEKKAQDFIPDITLVGKQDIWVEFAVSHPCSAAKLQAKQRIIEISIQSEADVELFRQHKLSAHDGRVKFIHFPERVPKDMCRWYTRCRLGKRLVVVYPNGRLDIEYVEKHQSLPVHLQSKVVWWAEEFIHRGDEPVTEAGYTALLREAALRSDAAVRAAGHTIRACGLCKHYDQQGEAGCLKFKTQVPWQEAIQCEHFAPTQSWQDADVD